MEIDSHSKNQLDNWTTGSHLSGPGRLTSWLQLPEFFRRLKWASMNCSDRVACCWLIGYCSVAAAAVAAAQIIVTTRLKKEQQQQETETTTSSAKLL